MVKQVTQVSIAMLMKYSPHRLLFRSQEGVLGVLAFSVLLASCSDRGVYRDGAVDTPNASELKNDRLPLMSIAADSVLSCVSPGDSLNRVLELLEALRQEHDIVYTAFEDAGTQSIHISATRDSGLYTRMYDVIEIFHDGYHVLRITHEVQGVGP